MLQNLKFHIKHILNSQNDHVIIIKHNINQVILYGIFVKRIACTLHKNKSWQ